MKRLLLSIVILFFISAFATLAQQELYGWGNNQNYQLGLGDTWSPGQTGEDNDWVQVSCSNQHTLAIKADGTLWAWGWNNNGQLGIGNTTQQLNPIQVGSGFASVACGASHTLGIKTDGTLWAWGLNGSGQLGNGNTTQQLNPIQVGSGFASVACGAYHTLGIKTDGTLWAWGYNNNGQLGDGTQTKRISPVQVGSGFTSVSCGYSHTLGIKTDGTLWAWGGNGRGQLGIGNTTTQLNPIQVGSGFASVSCGHQHTLAIKTDGTLWAWGFNNLGQLGIGNTTQQLYPIQVGSGFASVSCGAYYTLGIKTAGTLWAWGVNDDYQLGDGTQTNRTSPVQVGSGNDWVSVSCGNAHTLGIKTDGTLWAWGLNNYGQLGCGNTWQQLNPIQVGSGFASVSCGHQHTLAIKTDGTLWAWGNNNYGQLGDGTQTNRTSPVQVGSGFASVSCGDQHTLAIKTDGTLWAWGLNNYGQLGCGNTTQQLNPIQVGSGTDWVSVSCGYSHTLGIKTDGTLWAWGLNNYGQLGCGNTTQQLNPIQVGSGTDWVSVSCGYSHTLGIKTDGTLWAWGYNNSGQLGDGTQTNRTSPVHVGSGFACIACGGVHTLGIKTDGTLWAWGYNNSGQLGDGTQTNRTSPIHVGSGFASIACGGFHTLGIKTDGTLWAWGYNNNGQLGDGTTIDRSSPVEVNSSLYWGDIACSFLITMAITKSSIVINATAGNGGSITPSGEVEVENGADQMFTFTPDAGYYISKVLIDGADNPAAANAGTYTFTNVTENHSIEIVFSSLDRNTFYVDQHNGNDLWDGLSGVFTSGGNGPKATFQSTVDAAGDGDIIEFVVGSGPYSGIDFTSTGKRLTVVCNGINYNSASPVITVNSNSQITFQNAVFNDTDGTNDFFEINGSGNIICYSCTFISNGVTLNDCAAIKTKVSGTGTGTLHFNTPKCLDETGLAYWLDPTNIPNLSGEKISEWHERTNTPGKDAVMDMESRMPINEYDAINYFPGVHFSSPYGNTQYADADIMTSPFNAEITTATEDQWNPDNSPKTLIVVFKTGSSVDADGDAEPYYSDGRQVIFEAGGPLSGYNIYIINGKLAFGMWNRFQQKFMVYDPPMDNSIYPLDVNSVYIAQLEYNGTDFQATVSKSGGDMLVQSDQIPFAGLSKDGDDLTGVGGAARTCFQDYNTGETYSCTFNGAIGDVILYNSAFDQVTGQEVYDFLSDRYRLGTVTYPAPASGKISYGDWKVYEFEDAAPGDVMLSLAYPNPFDSKTNIGVNLPEDMNVEIELCDINGKVVKCVYSGNIGKGFHNFEINGGSLSSGAYIFRISSESFTKSCRLILNK